MKFGFIAKHRGIWPAVWLCEALGVSRSGFHAWLTRPPSARSRSDETLVAKVRASFIASDRTYGARRVWHDILAEGISCGLHRIERLMKSQALRARPRRRRLPSDTGQRIADAVSPNVLVNLRGAELVGAEGLARVRHPEHGIVNPVAFLPEASIADLIALAEHGLRTALRDGADFATAGYPLRLAINMPVEALIALPITAIVREAQPRMDNWSGIILEVTEDQVIRDLAAAHEIATQLRIHRIGLALDDFGSGYSSLARLRELPFAELKLDRSFVTGCGTDSENAALCKTIVELAHRFGSVAVAEGVETAADLTTIRGVGCDVAQGFLFARAMPKDSLLARLVANGTGGGLTSALVANLVDGNTKAIA